jgi:hypothetical protein
MGDVTTADLNAAFANSLTNSSNNSNGVALLSLTISDPPTQSEVTLIYSKLNELISTLRRP